MISHIFIPTSDFERAFAFYAPLMETLGLKLKFIEHSTPWAGWVGADAPRPLLLLGQPFDGQAAHSGNGHMLAMLAPSRARVDRVHAQAIGLGAGCEGPPGLRPHYHADYYGAYFRDPDGNKLCVCCHDPDPDHGA